MFPRILAFSAGMMAYGPLLETYLGGCVRSDEGTSLTANLQVLAENLVAMQGETAAVIVGDGWGDVVGTTAVSAEASGSVSERGDGDVEIV